MSRTNIQLNSIPTTQPEPGKPLFTGDKERYVKNMFAEIAARYDLLNAVLSFNQHKAWRRKAVRLADVRLGERCLDICTGTGDFAVDLAAAVGASAKWSGQIFASRWCDTGSAKSGELPVVQSP